MTNMEKVMQFTSDIAIVNFRKLQYTVVYYSNSIKSIKNIYILVDGVLVKTRKIHVCLVNFLSFFVI